MSPVSVETTADAITIISLNRPRANALDPELIAAISDAFASSANARAVVFASALPTLFSAGWDLRLLIDVDRPGMEKFHRRFCDLAREIFVFGRPVVAALPGHAIAGGLILAMAADERIVAQGQGKFGLSEVVLGVPVPACCLELFRHVIGAREMERLAAAGENLAVEDALAAGLVDRAVPSEELFDAALERARFLAGLSSRAYANVKLRARAAAIARFDQARDHDPFLDFWFSEDARFRIKDMVARLMGRNL